MTASSPRLPAERRLEQADHGSGLLPPSPPPETCPKHLEGDTDRRPTRHLAEPFLHHTPLALVLYLSAWNPSP